MFHIYLKYTKIFFKQSIIRDKKSSRQIIIYIIYNFINCVIQKIHLNK